MPRAGTKPKASFNTFSGSQLLHSSTHTLICCANTAELSHLLGKGNTTLCYNYKHFLQPWFSYLSPQPNSSSRSLYPHSCLGAMAQLPRRTGGISCPRTMVSTAHPAASWVLPGPQLLYHRKYSQKLSGVRGRGIITTQLQLLLQKL